MAIIDIHHLTKTFKKHTAVKDITLSADSGEMVALIGASGSGKSTLIRLIAGLDVADRGYHGVGTAGSSVFVLGAPVQKDGRLCEGVRRLRSQVGVIFQQFNLVGRLSLLTNVLMGLLGSIPRWRGTLGLFTRAEKLRAMKALHRVGIHDKATQRASTLSGGQQQRGAIARALVQGAKIILADEPIASLDPQSARRVMDILAEISRQDGITVLVSLHQVEYALRYCNRAIALKHGAVVFDGPTHALTPDFLKEIYGADSEELMLNDLFKRKERQPGGSATSCRWRTGLIRQ